MADRVLPIVRLLFACDAAEQDDVDDKWIVKNPWSVVSLPEGVSFPFDAEDICLYAQLAEGIGQFQLAAEIRHMRDDGSEKAIKRSEAIDLEFFGGDQLAVIDTAFHFKEVPFEGPGLYQFRVMANYAELTGQFAEIRVLERGDQL